MKVFGNYAKYYDLFYKDKDYVLEADYVDHLIRRFGNRTESILDMGCGTGQHDFHLAGKGYNITGVDFSDRMLSAAKERLFNSGSETANNLSFVKGDIREIRLGRTFDTVVSLFHVISYQTTDMDIENAFKTAFIHLKENGLFIFDCWYGPCVLNVGPETRVRRIEDDEVSITRIAEPSVDFNENTVDVKYQILIRDKVTQQTDEFSESHRMRYLFHPEVRSFLEKTGFEFVALLEFLKDTLPGPDSWSTCFIARKRG